MFVRLLEMGLPVGAVFATHCVLLLYHYAAFFGSLTTTPDSCAPPYLGVALATFAVGLLSTFIWGCWGVQPTSWRDGVSSSVVFVLYVYAQWPAVFACVGGLDAAAYQLVVGALLGALVVLAVVALVLRCAFRRLLHNSVAKARDARAHSEERVELLRPNED